MAKWKVKKFINENGRCPLDKWLESKDITTKDRAAFDAQVDNIERIEDDQLPPERVKHYQGTNLDEFKVSGDKKKLRPLCVRRGKTIILLAGAIEKGSKIPKGDIETAENLLVQLINGRGTLDDL